MSGDRQIEMTWRCTSCSARNLGRYKVCRTCGNAKDGSEEYEMPEDPSKAATVTEADLLRMATAGPDWRCAYCGSDQRRTDLGCQNCGAAAVEGAEVPAPPEPATPPISSAATRQGSTPGSLLAGRAFAVGCLAITVTCGAATSLMVWNHNRPRDFDARVDDVAWERTISVERYQVRAAEGFKEAMPSDAFDVTSVGKRHHHDEQVLDHYTTEHYTVQVPDGYRSESYTERVACGRDCTSRPKSCSEKCTSNRNGFATCKQVCSGGGESCTTRYCSERRTRQVPKTRSEGRTRQVPHYRAEPRFAEAFAWKRWEWLPARTVTVKGSDVNLRWPEANLGRGLGPGEKEREQRKESLKVTLSYGERSLTFVPANEEELARFPPTSRHALHTENGVFTLDGRPVTPLR